MRSYYWTELPRKREEKKRIERERLARVSHLLPFQPLLTSSGLVDLSPRNKK